MTIILEIAYLFGFFEHYVLEIWSVFDISCKGENVPTQMSLLERANLDHWTLKDVLSGVHILLTSNIISRR
jgi:hypothetical protein